MSFNKNGLSIIQENETLARIEADIIVSRMEEIDKNSLEYEFLQIDFIDAAQSQILCQNSFRHIVKNQ